jgi:protein-tyrosine kinase
VPAELIPAQKGAKNMSKRNDIASEGGCDSTSPATPGSDGEQKQPEEPDKMGRISPSYNVSRSIQLDPYLLLQNRCVAYQGETPEVDAYRILRTRIMHRADLSTCNTIMVTSALPGEGKTLTAINLALIFAKEFSQTVLLVDCDLRRQNIHEFLGYDAEKGLADYLLNGEPLSELIVWPGIEKLTVISGGKTLNVGSEFLASPGMKRLVQEMKHRYPERLVIFDVPPVLAGSDALAFAPLVDFVVMVVRAEQTSAKDVQKAVALLPKAKLLGLVLNGGTSKENWKYPAG